MEEMIVDIHDTKEIALLQYFCASQSSQGDITGLISGAWDIIHYHHILTLKRAKRLCDFLVVGVGTDRLVRVDKGSDRPVYPEEHRLGMIESIKFVDACFLMDSELDYGIMSRRLHYSKGYPLNFVMFKNEDWIPKLESIPDFCNDMAELDPLCAIYEKRRLDIGYQLHGNVMIIPDVDTISSTTKIIQKVKKLNGREIVDPYGLSKISC